METIGSSWRIVRIVLVMMLVVADSSMHDSSDRIRRCKDWPQYASSRQSFL